MERAAPNDARRRDARWRRGRALRLSGRVDEAQALQEALLREAPDDGWILGELGECHWSAGRMDDARAEFRRSLERLAGDPWALANQAGWLQAMRERVQGSTRE